jgi:Ca2+-binding EF-hand superfamily protein
MTRKAIALITASVAVSTISAAALAASSRTTATAERDVRQLIRMMDKDTNGVVSKEEFMDFMGKTFDRLDVNKSGTLEHGELHRMAIPKWPINDCEHVAFPQCTGGE